MYGYHHHHMGQAVRGSTSRSSRFDFSSGKGVVRPKTDKPYSTTVRQAGRAGTGPQHMRCLTYGGRLAAGVANGGSVPRGGHQVDMMMGSGLKYVHALKRGTGGMQGDLEKCRQQVSRRAGEAPSGWLVGCQELSAGVMRTCHDALRWCWCLLSCYYQLLASGFVAKENFDRDELDRYDEEKVGSYLAQPTSVSKGRRPARDLCSIGDSDLTWRWWCVRLSTCPTVSVGDGSATTRSW